MILSSAGGSIDLYSWLNTGDVDGSGFEALAGITGFGMPKRSNRWFEGAGDGATHRGARVLPRDIDLPLIVQGTDRADLLRNLSLLSTILKTRNGPARLSVGLPGGEMWYEDVVLDGGGDWARRGAESDNKTFVRTILTLRAGDPFWTRATPENFTVIQDNSGRGLLPDLAKMELSSAGAFGNKEVFNSGDDDAWPVWTMNGPFTSWTFTGADGEILTWTGAIALGEGLLVDSKNGTVYDFSGVNRYDGFGDSPRFWSISPGYSYVTVSAIGVDVNSKIFAEWRPRREAIV
jgi:hypothetical protein